MCRRRSKISLSCLSFLLGLLLWNQTVQADEGTQAVDELDPCLSDAQCKALVDSGRTLSAAQQYEGACLAYKAAYARKPVPWLLINIGRTQFKLGLYDAAISNLRKFIENTDTEALEIQRQKAARFLKEAEAAKASSPTRPPALTFSDAPQQARTEKESDSVLPVGMGHIRYKEAREARPKWRIVLGSLIAATGAGLIGGGGAELALNGTCADSPTPPVTVCPNIYSTFSAGIPMVVVGALTAGAGVMTIALPGRAILKPVEVSRPD